MQSKNKFKTKQSSQNFKSQRQLQVAENIKRNMSDILLREGLLNQNSSIISILQADISPDLKQVKIIVDIFNSNPIDEKKIIENLNKSTKHFRYELLQIVKLRTAPEVRFVLDRTEKQASKIESIIEQEKKLIDNINNHNSK